MNTPEQILERISASRDYLLDSSEMNALIREFMSRAKHNKKDIEVLIDEYIYNSLKSFCPEEIETHIQNNTEIGVYFLELFKNVKSQYASLINKIYPNRKKSKKSAVDSVGTNNINNDTVRVNRRNIFPETIKAKFSSVEDFTKYWTENDLKLYHEEFSFLPIEDIKNATKEVVDEVKDNFKEDCEIIHFSDFDIAPKMMEREYVLIRKNKEVVRSILIRMS